MEKFAGYGFNKSHSAAYALVAYQTAYFKAHHRGGVHGGEPVAGHGRHRQGARRSTTTRSRRDSRSCRRTSTRRAIASSRSIAKRIRYGLGGIKGTGEAAIEAIVAAREADGPFTDLFDFCRRVDKRIVNRRVVEALVRAGAFDAIDRAPRGAVRIGRCSRSTRASARPRRRRRCRCSARKRRRTMPRRSRRATGPKPSG